MNSLASPPIDLLDSFPPSRRPQLSDVLSLDAKSQLHRTDDDTVLLVPRPLKPINTGNNTHYTVPPQRIHVQMLMRPWVLKTCHATTSCHMGVSSTVGMLTRFLWWIGMDITAR